MNKEKIQDTKELLYFFSNVKTFSIDEQIVFRNGANAINQFQQEKEELIKYLDSDDFKQQFENDNNYRYAKSQILDKVKGE